VARSRQPRPGEREFRAPGRRVRAGAPAALPGLPTLPAVLPRPGERPGDALAQRSLSAGLLGALPTRLQVRLAQHNMHLARDLSSTGAASPMLAGN